MKYTKGYKYQLEEDYFLLTRIKSRTNREITAPFIMLDQWGMLSIYKGYAWDGSSGPAIDTENSMTASLVHDALYQLMRMKLIGTDYRRAIDQIYHDLCEDAGMWWPRRSWQHWAVREFAESAANPENRKEAFEV